MKAASRLALDIWCLSRRGGGVATVFPIPYFDGRDAAATGCACPARRSCLRVKGCWTTLSGQRGKETKKEKIKTKKEK